MEKLNIYKKINKVKELILNSKIKKTGKNVFSGFDYYELSDITPYIIKGCNEYGLYTHISFNEELATLTIFNCDNNNEILEFTSPMRQLQLKGCNDLQALGCVETYSRRYLYLMAFDIVEPDLFDKNAGNKDFENKTPTLEEIKEEMMDKNYTHFVADRFFSYYEKLNWKKNGKSINYKEALKFWEEQQIKKEQEELNNLAKKAM